MYILEIIFRFGIIFQNIQSEMKLQKYGIFV